MAVKARLSGTGMRKAFAIFKLLRLSLVFWAMLRCILQPLLALWERFPYNGGGTIRDSPFQAGDKYTEPGHHESAVPGFWAAAGERPAFVTSF